MRCLLFRLLLPALSPKLETPLSDRLSSVNITGRLMQHLLWKLRIPKIKDVLTLCKKALGRKALTQICLLVPVEMPNKLSLRLCPYGLAGCVMSM
jgi:hypothetical protein